jgi:hypothetical protein
MTFLFYVIYVILISWLSIIIGNIIVFIINLFFLGFFILALIICSLVYGTHLAKVLFKKCILVSLYFPIIIYTIFKLSIFLIDFFDKFNTPF